MSHTPYLAGLGLALVAAAAPAELVPQQAGEARFICGGVGQGEQQAIEQVAPRYDLMLTFATSTGAFLADVDVEIQDSRGRQLLATRCGGPIMLVALPGAQGPFRITARSPQGEVRQRTLSSGGRAVFTWPAS